MAPRLLNQAWKCYREFGADESLARLLARFKVVSEVHSLDVFVHELQSLRASSQKRITELSKKEIAGFSFAEGLPSLAKFHENFDRGSRLFAALENKMIIGLNWLNFKFADLTHIHRPHVAVPPDSAYTYGLLVSPVWQGKGVGASLKDRLLNQVRNEGQQFAFWVSFVRDIRISHWHLRNGCKKWGRVFYFRALGKDFWRHHLAPAGRRYPDLLKNHA